MRDERMDPGPEETGHKSVWQDGEQDEQVADDAPTYEPAPIAATYDGEDDDGDATAAGDDERTDEAGESTDEAGASAWDVSAADEEAATDDAASSDEDDGGGGGDADAGDGDADAGDADSGDSGGDDSAPDDGEEASAEDGEGDGDGNGEGNEPVPAAAPSLSPSAVMALGNIAERMESLLGELDGVRKELDEIAAQLGPVLSVVESARRRIANHS